MATKKKPPKLGAVKIRQLLADPQFGHSHPLTAAEKRLVANMRQGVRGKKGRPAYCLPPLNQHPKLLAFAAVNNPDTQDRIKFLSLHPFDEVSATCDDSGISKQGWVQ